VTLAGRLISFCTTHGTFHAAADLVLLLQNDASDGKPQCISLKMNWLGKIEVGQDRGFGKSVA
jgi:hypothetical protein